MKYFVQYFQAYEDFSYYLAALYTYMYLPNIHDSMLLHIIIISMYMHAARNA